jgi:uncharacterized protein (DUF1015 family)
MADLHPFRALRYAPDHAARHADLLCPPYDAVSGQELFRYFLRHPYNAVRIEVGQEQPEDDVVDNRHVRAASTLAQWRKEGVLRQDEIPSLYLHEQTHRGRSRRGILGIVRLDEAIRAIKPAHPERQAERTAMIKAVQANVSPLVGLYSDPDQIVAERVLEISLTAPFLELTDEGGGRHRLWKIIDPTVIHEVQGVLATSPLTLLDGHNRLAAAIAHRDHLNSQGADTDSGGHNFVLMELVDQDDPALVLEPWHRLVRVEGMPADLMTRLAADFDVTARAIDPDRPFPEQLEAIVKEQHEAGDPLRFGLILAHDLTYYSLRLKPGVRLELGDRPPLWSGLDAAWVHWGILDPLLGVPELLWHGSTTVAYARDPREVLVGIGSGQFQLAFLLNPPSPELVTELAATGAAAPRRTVDLVPRVPAGLVMRSLEGALD